MVQLALHFLNLAKAYSCWTFWFATIPIWVSLYRINLVIHINRANPIGIILNLGNNLRPLQISVVVESFDLSTTIIKLSRGGWRYLLNNHRASLHGERVVGCSRAWDYFFDNIIDHRPNHISKMKSFHSSSNICFIVDLALILSSPC